MPEIKFVKQMTTAPKIDANIYRLKGAGVNERTLLETARRLDLKGDKKIGELSITAAEMTYFEGPFIVRLSRPSGSLRYYDRTRWQMDDGKSNVEFSDEEAVNMATKFIKKFELAPMEECELFKVTRLHVGVIERGSDNAEERVIDVGVIFQRNVDKIPVDGPGGKVIVYLDHNGEVTGCDRIWRKIANVHRAVPSEQLRQPKYAEANLERYWRISNVSRIEITETRFGYFELGPGESQRHLQPAYIMPLNLISSDDRIVMKSVHVTLASSKPVGRIMPRHKVMVEELPREED